MQTFGLPRRITRGAALERWRQARADGLTARAAANAVGVPRSPLYRWQRLADHNRLEPCSRRPRRPAWSAALVTAVRETRADYPMWGKAKIAVLLRRNGHAASESTTGRILKTLMERGAVSPVPSLRHNGPRAARRLRPHARRLPRGRKPTSPDEIVQRDTLTVSPHPGRHAIKQFTVHDPVAKWTCAQAWRRATAHNARRFLDKLQADMPFPIEAIQVDGGSEFKADFDASAAASTCSRHARPSSTVTSSATTAHGDTSSTPHGTCPTTTSTTSTDGSTPSLTRPSDRTRPLANTPLPSTLPDTQLKNLSRLICPELGHHLELRGRWHQDRRCRGRHESRRPR